MTSPPAPRRPRQIPFIIAQEAGERFGFYGMRNVLTIFLVGYLLRELPQAQREADAKEVFHAFVMGVYFFPLLGGWLADRWWGRYRTILWLSLAYTAGYGLLAASTAWAPGFYAGLALVAFGSGGIKPCVSTFVGDQFDSSNKALAKGVFAAFYWSINLGSFAASFTIPLVLDGPEPWRRPAAFGIPGLLMALATLVFWLGRQQYVKLPPEPPDPHGFWAVVGSALSRGRGRALGLAGVVLAVASLALIPRVGAVAGLCLALVVLLAFGGAGAWAELDRARAEHPPGAVDGVRTVLQVLVLFALVTPFWSLFDQKASTWVLQGQAMTLPGWGWFKSASQMQAFNPLLVMVLIPLLSLGVYPGLKALGLELTPLRRMALGIGLTGVAWVVVGAIQLEVDALRAEGQRVAILWQLVPYAVLTLGEVLVSTTGLEFAYSQSPPALKSVVSAFWSLAVTVGNLWVLLVNAVVKDPRVLAAVEARGWGVTASLMFFFAAFAGLAALAFVLYARRYRMADYYRPAGS